MKNSGNLDILLIGIVLILSLVVVYAVLLIANWIYTLAAR